MNLDIITIYYWLNDQVKLFMGSALLLIIGWLSVWYISFKKNEQTHKQVNKKLDRILKRLK